MRRVAEIAREYRDCQIEAISFLRLKWFVMDGTNVLGVAGCVVGHWYRPFPEIVNDLIGWVSLVWLAATCLAGPFTMLFLKRERELTANNAELARKEQEIKRLSVDPKAKERLDRLKSFLARISVCQQWFGYLRTDDHFTMAFEDFFLLDREVHDYLRQEIPEALTEYVGQFILPERQRLDTEDIANPRWIVEVCHRRAWSLKQLVERMGRQTGLAGHR